MGMGHSVRHVLAALAFAGVLAFFCVLLVQAQVIQGEGYYETSLRSKAKVERVPAARGKILDRNGKVLVRDEVRWTAVVAEGAPEESRLEWWPGRRIRRPWVGCGMRGVCCLRPSGRRTTGSRRCSWRT